MNTLNTLNIESFLIEANAEKDLVGLGRLELPTSPLSGVRSNQLSYKPIYESLDDLLAKCINVFFFN